MILTVVATLLYLVFLAGVIAVTRSRSSKLREFAREGFFCARYGRLALTRGDRILHAAQVGLFLSGFCAGIGFAWWSVRLLGEGEVTWLPFGANVNAKLFAFGIFLLLYLAVALPSIHAARAISIARPNRTLCVLSVPLLFFTKILQPIMGIFGFMARHIGAWAGVTPISEREQSPSAEEINELVEKSTKAGQIEEDEREMIKHVFTFRDTVAREVMTPRKDVIAVKENVSLHDLTRVFISERLSRVLVVGDTLDDVKGVVLAKDLLPFAGRSIEDFSVRLVLRPAYFVPSTKNVDQLLEELRSQGKHFAVVLDEHGGVDGVVTLEDLVEELVGEILDEYDNPLDEAASIKTRTGDTLVDGGMNVHDFNTHHHMKLPEGPYDTVAGFIIQQLGKLPAVGEGVDWEGVFLKVEEIDDTRITQVRVTTKARAHAQSIAA